MYPSSTRSINNVSIFNLCDLFCCLKRFFLILLISVEDLAYWMSKFVLEARKTDGSNCPLKTLNALVCSFKRYWKASGVHDVNPLNTADSCFGSFRQTLDAEMKCLHAKGLGTKKKQAEPINPGWRSPVVEYRTVGVRKCSGTTE